MQKLYIREGMNYKHWLEHSKMVLKTGISLHIMVTANMLSIDTQKQLLTDVYSLKRAYSGVTYGVSILHSPSFLNVLTLPKTDFWIAKFDEVVKYVSEQPDTEPNELNYVTRLRNYFVETQLGKREMNNRLNDCSKFFQEIDRRRNKNFTNTFVNYSFI